MAAFCVSPITLRGRKMGHMAALADRILAHLQQVQLLRAQQDGDPALTRRVQAVKQYQQQRFERSYADLLVDPRYCAAARFFLEELYGPNDYRARDAQFARVVPALTRLFPREVVQTVRQLAELHALTESLDQAMALALPAGRVSAHRYQQAWQRVDQRAQRQHQLDLTLDVGAALQRYTGKPLLRQALRVMRAPAAAAGLSNLQQFLERGFDTFRAMQNAQQFLTQIRQREQALAAALFAPASFTCPSGDDPLGQLP